MLATNKRTVLICKEHINLRMTVVIWEVLVDAKVSSVSQISVAVVFGRNH